MHTQKPYHHSLTALLLLSLVLQNCGQPNQEFGNMKVSSVGKQLIDTTDQVLSTFYGPFVTSAGVLVTFQQERGSWTARMQETGTLVYEQLLEVGCAGDITKTLSQLQHQSADYVKSRIHVLSPTQSPTSRRAIYLGQLGLNGGMEQGEEKSDTSKLTSIHQAAQEGNLVFLKYLVEETEANVSARDGDGRTALHWAAQEGHLEVIKYLVEEESIDMNAQDDFERTALHYAAHEGHLAAIKYLAGEQKVDLNAQDDDGRTALHLAAEKGDLGVIQYLVEEENADVSARDYWGTTALHLAAQGEDLAIIKCLVAGGKVDINAQNRWKKTALHYAIEKGGLTIIKCLVEEGKADVNAQNCYKKTALHLAAQGRHLAIIKYLAEKEADVNARDDDGRTALHWAAQEGDLEVIKCLAEKGKADVSAQDNRRRTTLHLAAQEGHLAAIQYLVEETKADVNARDNRRKTALHWAAQKGHLAIVLYLMEEAKGSKNPQIIEDLEHSCFEQWENIRPYARLITAADMLYSEEDSQTLHQEKSSAITDASLKLKLAYKGQGHEPSKECLHDLGTAFSNRFKNRIRREGVPEAMLLDPEEYFKNRLLPDSLKTELPTFVGCINAGRELYILHASSLVALLEASEGISSTPLSFILCPPVNFRPYNPEDLTQKRTVEFYTQRSAELAKLVENAENVDKELSSEEIQRALCKYLVAYLSRLEPHGEIMKAVVEDDVRKALVVDQIESMLTEDDVLLPIELKAKLALLLKELLTPSVP